MSNKTLIPAFNAKVGDWNYYICHMKYGEVARQVNFAYELGGNKDLSTMIQRGISSRTEEITEYLLSSDHRFLGALIVAAWGGAPEYIPVEITDANGDQMVTGLDRSFGVLTFDGSQQYFALDGQHRLRAIKEALIANPELAKEDICVLMVAHYNTEEGRQKTRRLFTNINRNAKVTTGAENIVLDEDDGIAILTRRFITEHSFLSQKGRVKVINKKSDDGELKLAPSNIPVGDKFAWTSIVPLYDCLKLLAFGLPSSMKNPTARPANDVLDKAYDVLSKRIEELLEACGKTEQRLDGADNAREIRFPKGSESNGHPFMRPAIQKAVCKVINSSMEKDPQVIEWEELLVRLAKLDWRLGAAPWNAVYSVEGKKMLTGKEFNEVLDKLLIAHLAPLNKAFVRNARRSYRELFGHPYPYSEEDLIQNVVQQE